MELTQDHVQQQDLVPLPVYNSATTEKCIPHVMNFTVQVYRV